MTLKQLRDLLRGQRLDDVPAPQLWSDADLNHYLNEAEREAAIRMRCLTDSTTFTLTLVSGRRFYALDPLILEVFEARLGGKPAPLYKTSQHELDQNVWDWQTHTGDVSHWFMENWNQLGVYRTPGAEQAGGVITLSVVRRPLVDMEGDDDEPEIPEHFHADLLDWAEHLAFLKNDADTFNKARADAAEARFVGRCGMRPSANVLTQRAYRPQRQRVRGHYV